MKPFKTGTKRKKTEKIFAAVLAAVLLSVGLLTLSPYSSDAAAEKAVSDKSWDSVEQIIKKKLGTGYNEIGMCTGYVYWCLKNAYGVDWGKNSVVDTLEKKLRDKGITMVAEGRDGKLTADMKPGDIVIFLQGNTGMHCAVLGEKGRLYHARSSVGVADSPTLAQWMALPDTSKNCDRYRIYRGLSAHIDISVSVKKESRDKALTEGNDCYSLAGAQYEAVCGDSRIILTTDESGKAKGMLKDISRSKAGKVTVKEIRPSKGYIVDEATYTGDGSDGNVSVKSLETPVYNPAEMMMNKFDSETGQACPQRGASLKGAVFKADFYGTEKETEVEDSGEMSLKPLRTWYFETDEKGGIKWSGEYFSDGYEQSELYYSSGGEGEKQPVLPLGTLIIKEVEAPEGYLLNDEEYICVIGEEGSPNYGKEPLINVYQAPKVPEKIKRGDISLCKIEEGSQKRMANVPFRITSVEAAGVEGSQDGTGESHIVVTDANGFLSTSDSFNAHDIRTNENDKAWNGDTADISMLDCSAGIWFGEVSAMETGRGALPYGRYIIDELPCESNEGCQLVTGIEIEITRDTYTVELGTVTNDRIDKTQEKPESDNTDNTENERKSDSGDSENEKAVQTGDGSLGIVMSGIILCTVSLIAMMTVIIRHRKQL